MHPATLSSISVTNRLPGERFQGTDADSDTAALHNPFVGETVTQCAATKAELRLEWTLTGIVAAFGP